MKKAIKASMLLLVMMLTFSLVALCASADCTGELVNVAPQATITGDKGPGTPIDVAEDWINGEGALFWGVWDHFHLVNDENVNTLCPVTTHNASSVGIRVTLDGPYNLQKVVIYPYGGEGRVDSSSSWQVAGGAMAKENGYEMKVWLYAGDGSQIKELSFTAEKEAIEINTADYGEIAEIYIYMQEHAKAQGIWEVEAWTTETHKWEVQEITNAPSCYAEGVATVKCSTCGEPDEKIVPATGHADKCLGECANGCGLSMSISHAKDSTKPCSDVCSKCGVAGTVDATSGAYHIVDSTNPCDNTCVVCGEEKVPDAYDLGNAILMVSKYPTYTYAKHVANPDDPCDTTCASCGKTEAVKAEHVPDPDNPCTVSTCYKCGADGVFHTVSWGGIEDNFPHVRGEDGPITSVSGKYSCGIYCAKCGKKGALTWGHKFDNCDDKNCNICNSTMSDKEYDHTFTFASPTKCTTDGCTYSLVASTCEHEYDTPCDNKCNECGAVRYGWRDAGGYSGEYWHVYTNACDTTCNDCQAVRTPNHVYVYDCETLCNVCGETRTPTADHTYSDVTDITTDQIVSGSTGCDDICDVCKETREAPHNYAKVCSAFCSTCFRSNPKAAELHLYDNNCDTDCNTCGARRKIEHKYDNACDADCNVCGELRTPAEHKYNNTCDADCNVCGATRTPEAHKYDNACDTTCNVCNEPRTVGEHQYDNACDVTCNECGAGRTVGAHAYDNDCDTSCNSCGVTRAVAGHTYDAGVVTTAPTVDAEGVKTFTCESCGETTTEPVARLAPPAENKGLGAGAIVAIVGGSTIVVGAGGFSIFWFVIKKKTWADLIGVFKK